MTDRLKIHNGLEILSLSKRIARASFVQQFGPSYSIKEPSAEVIAAMAARASLQAGASADIAAPPTAFDQVNPKDTDYIYPLFRALSAVLLQGIWLDFSKEGVLKAAVPLFQGQTVYTDHGRSKMLWGRELSVNDWVGVISQALWDEKGESVGGTPGVNVEMKIDWTMNVKLARGLLMKPPAIHSTSCTILVNWDASHPELLEQRRFFDLLGEEVDGEIVRMVVVKVFEVWEQSLVFQGQDRGAKQLPGEDEEELSALNAGQNDSTPAPVIDLNSKKEKRTVKLTADQKTKFGLQTHEGDDVPDAIVLSAVDSVVSGLQARATSADAIVNAQRAEVLRLATLAEGVGEGETRKLDPAVAGLIEKADASQLPGLITLYQEKAAKQFPLTCQHGHPATLGRSSIEEPEESKGLGAAEEEDTYLL